jgi:hypothetical protein
MLFVFRSEHCVAPSPVLCILPMGNLARRPCCLIDGLHLRLGIKRLVLFRHQEMTLSDHRNAQRVKKGATSKVPYLIRLCAIRSLIC